MADKESIGAGVEEGKIQDGVVHEKGDDENQETNFSVIYKNVNR